jgi:hypothetical protein
MKHTTWATLAIVSALACACGGRVAPASGDGTGTDGSGTSTTRGGPSAKGSAPEQGSDSSGGSSSGDSSNGAASAGSTTNGSGFAASGSSGTSGTNGGSANGAACSVVLSDVWELYSNVTSKDATGGGISEGMPFQVGCNFSDDTYDYSFSATFIGGAKTGDVTTTDAHVTRVPRSCKTDCSLDSAPMTSCDFQVTVASESTFQATFSCVAQQGEDLPPRQASGSMNVMLVPDTLK